MHNQLANVQQEFNSAKWFPAIDVPDEFPLCLIWIKGMARVSCFIYFVYLYLQNKWKGMKIFG